MKSIKSRKGRLYNLPIFLPVYHPAECPVPMDLWVKEFDIQGCIVNAFFLYKDRNVRNKFENGQKIHEYIDFQGLIMTDSGAFQGFQGSLYLKNKTIVEFQEKIGSDIVSPLDLVSPPGERRAIAEKKWNRTLIRIKEAASLVNEAILAGVQQGGKFHDLRRQCTEELMNLGVSYLALGSLVPFLNKNHDLGFVGKVIRDARNMCGDDIPIHVYGAGDPVELPFMSALGANVFDSSSYAHYARQGWYMTPYGAIKDMGPILAGEFKCSCKYCKEFVDITMIFKDERLLASHNLWTILQTIKNIHNALQLGDLNKMLQKILEQHTHWFPNSALMKSWSDIYG
ncbi:MAG: tRNA-guanine transglycosylase [Desulfobacterales bacterium]|nr:tRNA-guanine transglycosylase [Desulfobacterales bacterium]